MPFQTPSLLEHLAHLRIAELLREAEQERLASLARGNRRPGLAGPLAAPGRRLRDSTVAALTTFAHRLASPRP